MSSLQLLFPKRFLSSEPKTNGHNAALLSKQTAGGRIHRAKTEESASAAYPSVARVMILNRERIDAAAGVKSLRFNRRHQGRIDEKVIRSNMFQVRQNR